MKPLPLLTLVLVSAALLPGAVFAQGIRNSRHDLSMSSSVTGAKATTKDEICVFCHSPHRAMSTQLVWNHAQTAVTTINWGNDLDGNALTTTIAGTPLPTSLRPASKRCMGCHDGTVSVGAVNSSSKLIAMTGTDVDLGGLLTKHVKATAAGTNLGGNHPVSVPYAGQTYYGVASGVAASQVGAAVLGGYFDVSSAGCSSASGVCTSAATAPANGANINLLPDGTAGTHVGVECTSCHEPHNKFGPIGDFLVVDNSVQSGLCRSCHNK